MIPTSVQIIIGSILILLAVFLTIAVLLQEGKSSKLSGAIAGGSDSSFGKTKSKKMSDTLSKVTTIVAIVFVVIVVVLAVINREIIVPNVDGPEPTDSEASESVESPSEESKAPSTSEEDPSASEEKPAASEESVAASEEASKEASTSKTE
ncbi:MAG: preprotein translocase subunit SecG [Clostridia bacterium]|nr:preprotein translocase subunit SecG [Clostridia bacterium]